MPIPIKCDRQGYSCNCCWGFGPTRCLLSESHLVTVLIASPECAYGGSQLFNQAWRSLSDFAKDLPHGSLELTKTCLLLLSTMILGPRYRNHHNVHLTTRQSFAFSYRLPCMGRINVIFRIFCGAFWLESSNIWCSSDFDWTRLAKSERRQTGLRRRWENLDATKEIFF